MFISSWMYVSTRRVNCGVFYVQPGGWFDPGNHPGPEPYYILSGTLQDRLEIDGHFVLLALRVLSDDDGAILFRRAI
jgi:hypothetical protein